jgi:integrase
MPSLRKRVYASGRKAWAIDYRVAGKAKVFTIGDVDKNTAKKIFREFCAKLTVEPMDKPPKKIATPREPKSRNVSGEAEPMDNHHMDAHQKVYTIPDLEREYMDYSRANKAENTCAIIQLAFWKLREFMHDIPLEEVTYQQIERFKAWRLLSVNGTTTNISLRALKAGFEYAVKIGWMEKNPFKGMKYVRVPEKNYPVYLSEEEVKILLEIIPDEEFRRLIRFYLLTGCRRTEAVMIDWRDISLDNETIVIRSTNTKTGKNRVLQIGSKLRILLLEQGPQESGLLFPKWTAGSVTAIFGKYVKRAGFGRKISVHSLRHTATVHFLMAGVPMITVSKILGHTSITVTETVYAHIPTAKKKEAMDMLPY